MTASLVRRIEIYTGAILSLVVLYLVGLRLMYAGALWRDESAVVQLAGLPHLREILDNFTHEAFPPPFHILVRCWMALFGSGDFSLRSYGALVAILIVVTLWLAFRALRTEAPLLSLGCVCLSATFLVWGTSVRGYGLGTVFILAAFGLIGSLFGQVTRWRLGLALLFCVLSAQVILQNVVILFALVISGVAVCFLTGRWRLSCIIAGIGLISVVCFLPYAPSYLAAVDWSVVVESPKSNPAVSKQLGLFFGNVPTVLIRIFELGSVAVLGAAGWRLFRWRDRNPNPERDLLLFAILVFLTALIGTEIFFRSMHYVRQAWYLLAPLSIGVATMDLLIAMLWRSPWLRLTRVGLAAAAVLLLGWTNWPRLLSRQTNVDLVARLVAVNAAPDDLILVNPWQLGVTFNRYYDGKTTWITLPQIEDHRMHRYDLLKSKMMSPDPIADVLQRAAKTLQSGHRLWLVGGARLPAAGERHLQLPPAPSSQAGWDNVAYGWSWAQELGQFIQDHAAHMTRVFESDLPRVNPEENVHLVVADGWSVSSDNSSPDGQRIAGPQGH